MKKYLTDEEACAAIRKFQRGQVFEAPIVSTLQESFERHMATMGLELVPGRKMA